MRASCQSGILNRTAVEFDIKIIHKKSISTTQSEKRPI